MAGAAQGDCARGDAGRGHARRHNPFTDGFIRCDAIARASFRVQLRPIDVGDAVEIEQGVKTFADMPDGGLIVPSSARNIIHRDLIISLAALHRLPAVYTSRIDVASGGLISYGSDNDEQLRGAAGYVDRILKGEKPADLPVQTPTKFEMAINLKTAKALGLTVPPSLLLRADEVVE